MKKIIRVHVQTHARNEEMEEIDIDEYKIWTHAVPEDGKANESIIDIIAEYFNIPISLIRIKSGSKSKHKLVEIDN